MRAGYIILLFILGLFVMGEAQTFTVYPDSIVNTTFDPRYSANVYIHFPNVSNQPIDLVWDVTNSSFPPGWLMSVCDNNLCYSLPHPTDTMSPVIQGDSGFLKMICVPLEIEGTGTISFHVFDKASPSSSADVTFNFNATTLVGADPRQFQENLVIGPNPTQSHITISTRKGLLDKGTLKMFDIKGIPLLEQSVSPMRMTEMNVESLDAGLYLLRYESKSGSLTTKVVITK